MIVLNVKIGDQILVTPSFGSAKIAKTVVEIREFVRTDLGAGYRLRGGGWVIARDITQSDVVSEK